MIENTRLFTVALHQRVVARVMITEDDAEPDSSAGPCESGWTHCVDGDTGTVVYVDATQEHLPTVRWDRTGTATICGLHEIELLAEA
jgi:hypothetical protein